MEDNLCRSYLFDDRLKLKISIDSLFAHLPPNPRILISSKRRTGSEDTIAILENSARFQSSDNILSFFHIFTDDSRSQTILIIIGSSDDLIYFLVFQDALNWSEDLLTGYHHLVMNVGENCRLDKETDLSVTLATGCQSSPLFHTFLDIG